MLPGIGSTALPGAPEEQHVKALLSLLFQFIGRVNLVTRVRQKPFVRYNNFLIIFSAAVTFGVGRLSQSLDVQSFADVVLDGAPVTAHHAADGFSQDSQVVEDLQGCAHLSGILSKNRSEVIRSTHIPKHFQQGQTWLSKQVHLERRPHDAKSGAAAIDYFSIDYSGD